MSERVSAAEGASETCSERASCPVLTSLFLFVPDHSATVAEDVKTIDSAVAVMTADGVKVEDSAVAATLEMGIITLMDGLVKSMDSGVATVAKDVKVQFSAMGTVADDVKLMDSAVAVVTDGVKSEDSAVAATLEKGIITLIDGIVKSMDSGVAATVADNVKEEFSAVATVSDDIKLMNSAVATVADDVKFMDSGVTAMAADAIKAQDSALADEVKVEDAMMAKVADKVKVKVNVKDKNSRVAATAEDDAKVEDPAVLTVVDTVKLKDSVVVATTADEVKVEDSAVAVVTDEVKATLEMGIIALIDGLVPGSSAAVAKLEEPKKFYFKFHAMMVQMLNNIQKGGKHFFFDDRKDRLKLYLQREREVCDTPKDRKESLINPIIKKINAYDLGEISEIPALDQLNQELRDILKEWEPMKKNKDLSTSSRFCYWIVGMQKRLNHTTGDIDTWLRENKKVKHLAKRAYAEINELRKKLEEVRAIFDAERQAAREEGALAQFDQGHHLSSREPLILIERGHPNPDRKSVSSNEMNFDQQAASPASPSPSMKSATTASFQSTEITSTLRPAPRFAKHVAAIDDQYAALLKGLCQNYPRYFLNEEDLPALFQEYEQVEAMGQLWKGDDWKKKLSKDDLKMEKKAEAELKNAMVEECNGTNCDNLKRVFELLMTGDEDKEGKEDKEGDEEDKGENEEDKEGDEEGKEENEEDKEENEEDKEGDEEERMIQEIEESEDDDASQEDLPTTTDEKPMMRETVRKTTEKTMSKMMRDIMGRTVKKVVREEVQTTTDEEESEDDDDSQEDLLTTPNEKRKIRKTVRNTMRKTMRKVTSDMLGKTAKEVAREEVQTTTDEEESEFDDASQEDLPTTSDENRKMREAVRNTMRKTMRKITSDMLGKTLKEVAMRDGGHGEETGEFCAYFACGAALRKPLQRCGACQKHRLRPFVKPFKIAHYCGYECMVPDWKNGHCAYHQVGRDVHFRRLGYKLFDTLSI